MHCADNIDQLLPSFRQELGNLRPSAVNEPPGFACVNKEQPVHFISQSPFPRGIFKVKSCLFNRNKNVIFPWAEPHGRGHHSQCLGRFLYVNPTVKLHLGGIAGAVVDTLNPSWKGGESWLWLLLKPFRKRGFESHLQILMFGYWLKTSSQVPKRNSITSLRSSLKLQLYSYALASFNLSNIHFHFPFLPVTFIS